MNAVYRPPRLLLQWHLTDRCNLRCAHCYQDDYRDQDSGLAGWLPILEQFRAFLAATSPRIKGQLTLTGGDARYGLSVEETQEFVELLRQTKLKEEAGLAARFGKGTEIVLHPAR